MAELKDLTPGSRWSEQDGDEAVILAAKPTGVVVGWRKRDGAWSISEYDADDSVFDLWEPWVDAVVPEDGFALGAVLADGSFLAFTYRTDPYRAGEDFPGSRVFRYGVRAGELFIEWVDGT